jgi:hypothetical protein
MRAGIVMIRLAFGTICWSGWDSTVARGVDETLEPDELVIGIDQAPDYQALLDCRQIRTIAQRVLCDAAQ